MNYRVLGYSIALVQDAYMRTGTKVKPGHNGVNREKD